jgi:hypothetical protein
MRSQLVSYASGNGALSFTWLKNNNFTGRKVTLADVKRFLANPKNAHYSKYRIYRMGGQFMLAAYVVRVDDTTLQIGDGIYHYKVEGELFQVGPNRFGEFNTSFTFDIDHDGSKREFALKNVNNIMALLFFLNNEEELNKQNANYDIVITPRAKQESKAERLGNMLFALETDLHTMKTRMENGKDWREVWTPVIENLERLKAEIKGK